MNEQLQQALATILKKSTDGIDTGVSFLSAQLPEVAQQLLAWKLAENCFWIIACLAIPSLMVIGFRAYGCADLGAPSIFLDEWHRSRGGRVPADWLIPISIIGISLSIICLVALPMAVGDVLQITLAPKIYLIEYTANLVK